MGLVTGALGAAGTMAPGHAAEQQVVQRQLARDLAEAGPSLDERTFSDRQELLEFLLFPTPLQSLVGATCLGSVASKTSVQTEGLLCYTIL